jgi:hypothetical protein
MRTSPRFLGITTIRGVEHCEAAGKGYAVIHAEVTYSRGGPKVAPV